MIGPISKRPTGNSPEALYHQEQWDRHFYHRQSDVPGAKVLRTTRGNGSGSPGTILDDGLTVACGEGALRVLELQRAGKQVMTAEEFLRGSPLPTGTRLA